MPSVGGLAVIVARRQDGDVTYTSDSGVHTEVRKSKRQSKHGSVKGRGFARVPLMEGPSWFMA